MSYGGYEFNADTTSYGGADPMQTSPNPASSSDKKPRKPTSDQFLLPCTIKQCLKAASADGQLLVDGQDPHQIKLVACVKSKEEGETANTYELEDGTGLIEVKEWINSTSDGDHARARRALIQPNCYVRVVGKLSQFGGKVNVTAWHTKLVASPNEVTHHFLDAIWCHENATRGLINGAVKSEINGISTGVGFGPQSSGVALMDTSTGGGDKKHVQDYIQQFSEETEQGVALRDIVEALGGKGVSESAIRNAIQGLSSDGMIYSTIDEETFKYAM
ncbi:hypothetical protein TrVE_jg13158 [Triparma verrucosa]|uniref:Replication protein A C-terminal domain-containing protein n=1 Tax=Triparma verrucosa TaxID=1606542 RepID=A0A9W7BRG2_9STRA|nr:hypothetical protein TrVE_jg13158 [Triparma verrucosa]